MRLHFAQQYGKRSNTNPTGKFFPLLFGSVVTMQLAFCLKIPFLPAKIDQLSAFFCNGARKFLHKTQAIQEEKS